MFEAGTRRDPRIASWINVFAVAVALVLFVLMIVRSKQTIVTLAAATGIAVLFAYIGWNWREQPLRRLSTLLFVNFLWFAVPAVSFILTPQ